VERLQRRLGEQYMPKALALVMEWATQHQQELLEDWALAQQHALLKPIKPLE